MDLTHKKRYEYIAKKQEERSKVKANCYNFVSKQGLNDFRKKKKYFVLTFSLTDGIKEHKKVFPICPHDLYFGRLTEIGLYSINMLLQCFSTKSKDKNHSETFKKYTNTDDIPRGAVNKVFTKERDILGNTDFWKKEYSWQQAIINRKQGD